MDALLDLSVELSIPLLDQVVATLFSGTGQTQQEAQRVLSAFQEHPDAWTKVDGILEHSGNSQTKVPSESLAD